MKKLFAILSLMALIMATSTCAYASGSSEATTIAPTTSENSESENPTTSGKGNNESPISPKTGDSTSSAFAFVLLFTGMGTAVIAKKKLSEQ